MSHHVRLATKASIVVLPLLVSLAACGAPADEAVGIDQDALSARTALLAVTRRGAIDPVLVADRAAALAQGKREDVFASVANRSRRADGTFDLAPHEVELRDAIVTSFARELAVEREIDVAWGKVPVSVRGAHVAIDEAVRLALVETHVLTRRSLRSPKMHSRVPGLGAVQGCRGDVLVDELVVEYARSVTGLVKAAAANEQEPLRKVATQIACLGARQLAELELALSLAASGVESRLVARGRGVVVPSFVRAVAPLMLLVADAQKHRGARSMSVSWFRKHKAALLQTIAKDGWSASGRVFLYDRRSAVLEGFPECAVGNASRCVDSRVLLETVTDPRALGHGACGFAAMVAGGTVKVPVRGSRYVCPAVDCATPVTSPDNVAALDVVRSRWPELRGATNAELGAPGCLPGQSGTRNLQGGAPEECDAGLVKAPTNPFEEYTACTLSAAQGPGADGAVDTIGGMPLGPQCGLVDGDASTDPPVAPEAAQATPTEAKEAKKETTFLEDVANWFSSTWDALTTMATQLYYEGLAARVESGGPSAGIGVVVGIEKQLLSAEGAQFELGLAQTFVNQKITALLLDGRITEQQYYELREMKPAEAAQTIRELQAKANGGGTCVDAFACTNTCTGLGAQLTKATACSEGLVRSIMTAAGRPVKAAPGSQRDLSRVSKPHPSGESPSSEATGASACFLGALDPRAGSSANCSLIVCESASSTSASTLTPTGTSCCGGRVTAPTLMRNDCFSARCSLSTVDPNSGSCGCGDVGAGGEIVPKLPEPEPPITQRR